MNHRDACHASPAPAWNFSFGELIWVAYENQTLAPVGYRYFKWNAPQSIPNTETWQMIPDDPDGILADYAAVPLITCDYQSATGLDSLFNGTPNSQSTFDNNEVITFITRETDNSGPGRMSMFGTAGPEDVSNGLDDFQDGWGCGDDWQPISQKGASSMIAIR
jgi:hypothetical protein